MGMRHLALLKAGEGGRIKGVRPGCGLSRRLMDLGFTPGARAECVLAAPGRGMRAYKIRNTVVALRRRDAEDVLLEDEGE